MKALKVWLFAGVFALAAIFTLNANAGKTITANDCWTNPGDVGISGLEDQSTVNCKSPFEQTCCYIVNPNDPQHPTRLLKPNMP